MRNQLERQEAVSVKSAHTALVSGQDFIATHTVNVAPTRCGRRLRLPADRAAGLPVADRLMLGPWSGSCSAAMAAMPTGKRRARTMHIGRGRFALITLQQWLEGLRAELDALNSRVDSQGVRFVVGPVELEAQIVSTHEESARGGVKFWVVEAGVDGKDSHAQTQKIKITLTPVGPQGDVVVNDQPPELPD